MHNIAATKEAIKSKTDFLRTSAFRSHLITLIILLPFTIKHLIDGYFILVICNCLIFAVCSFNIWSILKRNHYDSRLTLVVLTPAVIISLLLSINVHGVIGVFSFYLTMTSFYFVLPERQAWFASFALLCTSLPIAWAALGPNEAISLAIALLAVSLFSAIFVNVIYTQQRQLHSLAATDILTGLFNRTTLYQSLEQAIEQKKRKSIDMTIVTFDIDHFKAINDTYGHDVGDNVLQDLGTLLNKRIRRSDRVFRLGGEEFMVLLFGAALEEGQEVAEDLRSLIESTPFLAQHPVTVSLGVATLLENENITDWVKRSDEHLYIAKSSGRNKVVYQNTINALDSSSSLPIVTVN